MLQNCATQCSLQSAGRKLCWSAVTRQVLKCTVEEEESPVKWYKDFLPWFYASHVDHRILVALGELAGIMEFRFNVPEHNCTVLWSALCMMFSLNTIVIRVRTSKTDSCGCSFSFTAFFRVVFLCYDYWGHLFRFTTAQSFFLLWFLWL